ncbi:hypothetical protein [Enteractinococcus helveticum]|uniref:Uncharacterized protein n=1 Tax=Enteractinococcus helveticum TaxID=1837282 RepID=A0A1B7M0M1_9MICC|nr:hypothetical protein [Enteractinococcus helveticum]OAV61793.1 hypothetical protein A6F49_07820 [Enteractinococcus helveticum]
MKRISRNMLAVTASASLFVLAGCGGQGVEDVPALSEIDDLMWETMQNEGSVTMTADLALIADGDPMVEQMFGGATDMSIYGALDGSATGVSVGDNDFMRVFGQEEAFISGDALFAMFEGEGLGLDASQQEQLDAVSEEFADNWIDFSSELSGEEDEFNIGALFSRLQDDWTGEGDSSDTPVDRDEVSDQGTHEVRDDIDVWVYTGEEDGQELVLIADHDAPKFYELSDDEMTMKFTGWGETESPTRPDDASVLSQEDAQQRIMETLMSGAMGSN